MRSIRPAWVVLILAACSVGCGPASPPASDLPPGVRKNEDRNTSGAKHGKPKVLRAKQL
jgi:hypothetical protein